MNTTTTKEELKTIHGEDILFVFKGTEPFTTLPDTKTPLGVLIEKDDKVLCFECGSWHTRLGHHIHSHNLTARTYKQKYGFKLSSGLCSTKVSGVLSKAATDGVENGTTIGFQPGNMFQRLRKNIPNTTSSMQTRNKRSLCPEQIKYRMQLLAAKVGHSPSVPDALRYDSSLPEAVTRFYGNWNEGKKMFGFEIYTPEKPFLKTNEQKYKQSKPIADLVYDLRDYIQKYQTLPWVKNRRQNGFPHSKPTYLQRWGSSIKAWEHCGIKKTWKGNGLIVWSIIL